MRTLTLLLLAACTGAPPPPKAPKGIKLEVRLPEARDAVEVEHHVFVWPRTAPPAGDTHTACEWWEGRRAGLEFARTGTADGTLGWGVIDITQERIGFDGQQVAPLENGEIVGDIGDDLILNPLYEKLLPAREQLDAWNETCGSVFRDRVLVAADADLPTQTLSRVLFTLSQLRFDRVGLLVGDREPTDRDTVPPKDSVPVTLLHRGDVVEAVGPDGIRRATGKLEDLESLTALALDGKPLGCTLYIPTNHSRVEQMTAVLDASYGFGSRRVFAMTRPREGKPGPAPERPGRSPSERISVDTTGAVVWLDAPVIGVHEDSPVSCHPHEDSYGPRFTPPELLADVLLPFREEPGVHRSPMADLGAFGGTGDPGESRIPSVASAVLGPDGYEAATVEARATLTPALVACATEALDRLSADSPAELVLRVKPDGAASASLQTPLSLDDPLNTCLMDAARAATWPAPGPHQHAMITWTVSAVPAAR